MPPLPDIMVKYHQNGSSFTSKSYLAYVSDGPNCLGPGRKEGLMTKRLMVLVAAIVVLAAITTSAGALALSPTEHYANHPLRVRPGASTSPTGLSPATIKSVYNFPTSLTAGAGKTIAIVDAFDDPTAESDLGVFSSQYGLPACTTANGCFTKVNQTGGSSYPRTDSGWALEISLDIQWAHAIAPGAKILLVEATTNSFTNLLIAEDYAKTHAQYVSNSWGTSEFSSESSFDSHFTQPGVSFFASSGDSGLPPIYPSASPRVISVGGTTLHFSGATFTSETGWSGSGGGCSVYETATSTQAGDPGRVAGCRPGLRRVGLRLHPLPGPEGLVHGRRDQRVVADVGRAVGRGRRDRGRQLRLRQQHHLPGHHRRQQRRAVPGRLRPGHRPRQLDRLARRRRHNQDGRPQPARAGASLERLSARWTSRSLGGAVQRPPVRPAPAWATTQWRSGQDQRA